MEVVIRAVGDRVWRSTQKTAGVRRGCAVRVLAFNNNSNSNNNDVRRAPTAPNNSNKIINSNNNNGVPAAAGAAATAVVPPAPLLLPPERIDSLSPAEIAAGLLNLTEQQHHHQRHTTRSGNDSSSSLIGAVARRLLTQGVADFDGPSLVDLLHAFSRVGAGTGGGHRDVLAICFASLAGKLEQLPPPALTRLAEACAALDLQATDLLAAVCSRAAEPEILTKFSAAQLTSLLVALSRLQHRSPALYADAAELLAAELQAAAAATAAGAAWRGMGWGGSSSRGQRADGEARGAGLGPEAAVEATWALAAAELYHRQVFDAAGILLMDRLTQLDGNSLAKIAWSFACVRSADEGHRGLWDRDLFDSLAGVCLDRGVGAYPPRALVTLMWSFASIPHYDGPLFEALSAALTPHLAAMAASAAEGGRVGAGGDAPGSAASGASASLAPSDLVAIAWSVQRVGHSSKGGEGLMGALGGAALAAVERLDGDDLTTIALAFPAAKAYNAAFFKYLVSEAQVRPQLFGQVALLDLIRLISRVQHRDPDYYGPALQVLLEHVHKAFLDAPLDKSGCMNPFRFG